MKRNILFTFALLVLSIQVAFAQNIPDVRPELTGYLLGPGDKIQVKVLGEDQFNFETQIDQNGRFRVPFVEGKPLDAKCRTENDLREEVEERYSKYLKNPTISLTISERRPPIPVSVSGEVNSPGQVELRREARLIELLNISNGPKEEAAGTVRVFSTQIPMCSDADAIANWNTESNNGATVPSRLYSISSVMDGKKEANPVIYPGDVIVVEKASPVYINGEVNQPTGLYIKERGLSLSQALAMVGGPRDKANLKEIKIYRLKANSQDREIIPINFKEIQAGKNDVMLEPYDIIDVDKRKKGIGEIIFETVTGAARGGLGQLTTGGITKILY
ncbi:MAG: SLBB domain-containing protein [Aridibacter sp.]